MANTETQLIINNETDDFDHRDVPLSLAFSATEQSLGRSLSIELNFLPLDAMFHLNNQLRQKPTATDVISLPHETHTGEVYICPAFIFQDHHSTDRILHLFVHGLLHISGYTHDHDEDFKAMSLKEIDILNQAGVPNPYA
ncbi:rRNA maturation RNase YbeY [Candidatus Synchoanobacter obligatus]|uniref:Endoribonuclease YbeY n=1 Tax=Candidatus Synchoanobacter obligatus TaxID=2919597 RepID=A0ABT1L5X1_9GAMM|nr:rRNA maturation RNase YbeY [Candidatus Synchoanobacter obligatus]MCP8352569.1 rRNA maturation RNase YbeY [Candidatus Synchoanobacter obligatus]